MRYGAIKKVRPRPDRNTEPLEEYATPYEAKDYQPLEEAPMMRAEPREEDYRNPRKLRGYGVY